jgi:uncharacterized protein (DUF1330 family)
MSYYFLAHIRIHDKGEYQLYLDRADEVFARYKGRYLAVDNEPEILEGEWGYDRAVLIQFESREDFMEWYNSEDYQEILKFRLNAADCDTILVKGK